MLIFFCKGVSEILYQIYYSECANKVKYFFEWEFSQVWHHFNLAIVGLEIAKLKAYYSNANPNDITRRNFLFNHFKCLKSNLTNWYERTSYEGMCITQLLPPLNKQQKFRQQNMLCVCITKLTDFVVFLLKIIYFFVGYFHDSRLYFDIIRRKWRRYLTHRFFFIYNCV